MNILKIDSTGEAVKEVQEILAGRGYTVGEKGVDSIYGEQTKRAVESFQRSNKIRVDGEVGPDTMRLLRIVSGKAEIEPTPTQASSELVAEVLKVAAKQVGVKENPRNSNRGKEVESYLASIGLGGGYAWCMAFVYWCTKEAAQKLETTNPLFKTGGVLNQWNQRKNLQVTRPKAGDVFIMQFKDGAGHTGFVTKVEGQYIHTIEGNTNNAGSREGDGVYRRVRTISSCKGFLRLDI